MLSEVLNSIKVVKFGYRLHFLRYVNRCAVLYAMVLLSGQIFTSPRTAQNDTKTNLTGPHPTTKPAAQPDDA